MLAWLAGCTTPAPDAQDNARGPRALSSVPHDPAVGIARTPNPLTIPIGGDPTLGSPDAAIVIVEFSDYQCPYCREFHARVLPRLKEAYIDTGVVRFVFKDLPLAMHPEAFGAAVAAGCAGAQDRYLEMQQRLYAPPARLGRALYAALARELKLDAKRFAACLDDPRQQRAVRFDMRVAEHLGIRGTPSFAVGRVQGDVLRVERIATGAASFEAFAREIEALRK